MTRTSSLVNEMKLLKYQEAAQGIFHLQATGKFQYGDTTKIVNKYRKDYDFVTRTGILYHVNRLKIA